MHAEQARALALGQPGAVAKPHHALTSFRLPGPEGRIFATLTPDSAELRLFIQDAAARDAWIARELSVVEPLFWGARRCGVKLPLARARPAWVRELLGRAWRELGGVSA